MSTSEGEFEVVYLNKDAVTSYDSYHQYCTRLLNCKRWQTGRSIIPTVRGTAGVLGWTNGQLVTCISTLVILCCYNTKHWLALVCSKLHHIMMFSVLVCETALHLDWYQSRTGQDNFFLNALASLSHMPSVFLQSSLSPLAQSSAFWVVFVFATIFDPRENVRDAIVCEQVANYSSEEFPGNIRAAKWALEAVDIPERMPAEDLHQHQMHKYNYTNTITQIQVDIPRENVRRTFASALFARNFLHKERAPIHQTTNPDPPIHQTKPEQAEYFHQHWQFPFPAVK